jgi:hypothetical protein
MSEPAFDMNAIRHRITSVYGQPRNEGIGPVWIIPCGDEHLSTLRVRQAAARSPVAFFDVRVDGRYEAGFMMRLACEEHVEELLRRLATPC